MVAVFVRGGRDRRKAHTEKRPCEYTVRKGLFASQRESIQEIINLSPSHILQCLEIIFCFLGIGYVAF
jgi:hypothetical protein